MRVPRELERLIENGASLSAADADMLERNLEQRADDLDARARLLGYYQGLERERFAVASMGEKVALLRDGASRHPARARHALWLAAHAPRAPLAGHDLVHFRMSDAIYAELSGIWRRHAAADPPDATLLAHAIAFFWTENPFFADGLLARAEELFPADPRWPRFRRDERARELLFAHRMRRVHVVRPSASDDPADQEPTHSLETKLEAMERLLRECEPDEAWMPDLRHATARGWLEIDRPDRARAHAELMLVSPMGEPERALSDDVHNGHLLLGRIALRDGDIERAKAHLLLAGRAGATASVPIFGPDMTLAQRLLVRGEREAVTRYLALCQAFWPRGPIDEWIAEIRAGGFPDFSRYVNG
jgi:hypothetical protein